MNNDYDDPDHVPGRQSDHPAGGSDAPGASTDEAPAPAASGAAAQSPATTAPAAIPATPAPAAPAASGAGQIPVK